MDKAQTASVASELETLRRLLDTGALDYTEYEAARLAVFRKAMMYDGSAAEDINDSRPDVPGL